MNAPFRLDRAELSVLGEAAGPRIAVVIPCFRVSRQVVDLIARIGPEVSAIFAIDDCCPEKSGDVIEAACSDRRVRVLRHKANQGVGGAMITGFRAALADGADIVVKLDGDGQMDPELIPAFVFAIVLIWLPIGAVFVILSAALAAVGTVTWRYLPNSL